MSSSAKNDLTTPKDKDVKSLSFAYTCAVFAIVVIATGLGGMTQTALNTMATDVLADLDSDIGWGQWLTTLYIFSMGAAVPLASFIQKRFSIRHLMLGSLILYFAGSACDMLAMNLGMLLIGRILEALGTGILMPLLQTIAMTRFPENRHGTAMGIAGIALGFAPNMGPVAGGAICDALGWRYMFMILSITSAILIILTCIIVRERKLIADKDPHLDWISLSLSTLGFGGILFGLTAAANMGLANPAVWLPVVVGVVCVYLFIRRQRRIEHPLVNLDIFKYGQYSRAVIIQCLLYGCFVGMTLIIPLTMTEGAGHSVFEAGIVLFPGALMALVFEPAAGVASDKFGVRKVSLFGAFFLTLGAVGISFIPLLMPIWVFAMFQALRCIGMTTLIPSTTSWGLGVLGSAGLTPDGSAALIMSRQIFASFATAVMVYLVKTADAAGLPTFGFHLALGFSGLLGMFVLIFAFLFVQRRRRRSA